MRILRVTRGQHTALISIVGGYMRVLQNTEPQTFVDCSQDPPEETTTSEIFDLLINFGLSRAPECPNQEEKKLSGVTAINNFAQLRKLAADIFTVGTPAHDLAMQFIDTARECGKVEVLRELEARRQLEQIKPLTERTQ